MDALRRDFIVAGGCGIGVLRAGAKGDVGRSDDGAAVGVENCAKLWTKLNSRRDKK